LDRRKGIGNGEKDVKGIGEKGVNRVGEKV
jgi:hypothetical protein